MHKDWVASSSLVRKSSTSQRRLRVFLAGGGADGEEGCAGCGAAEVACSRGEGDAWRSGRGGVAHMDGSV
jgi:hypothetical protein